MGYVVGGVVGVVVGVACVLVVGGVPGIVAGAAVAALLYLGLGELLKPEARLGGMIASMLPDGEAAVARVEEARELSREMRLRGSKVRRPEVSSEVEQLAHDIDALVACVEEQPSCHRRLGHFLSTYAEQCVGLLDGYLSVERLGTPELRDQAAEDAVEALNAVQGAAQGELARATGVKATQVEASSDAIRRLMEMDGHRPDGRGAPDVPPDGGGRVGGGRDGRAAAGSRGTAPGRDGRA